jgi:hypothetical protein
LFLQAQLLLLRCKIRNDCLLEGSSAFTIQVA